MPRASGPGIPRPIPSVRALSFFLGPTWGSGRPRGIPFSISALIGFFGVPIVLSREPQGTIWDIGFLASRVTIIETA